MALNKFTQIGNSGFGTDTSINTTGIVTAASFSGDGSGLTGVTALGSGVVVQEEGSNVGTAQTINFIGSGVTATFSGGIASVEIATSGGGGGGGLSNVVEDTTPQLGGNLDLNSNNITGTGDINITGDATFSGDLDVDGHVNLDNVSIAGVSTFSGNVIIDANNQLRLGTGENSFFYVGSDNDTYLQTNNNELLIGGPTVRLQSYGSVGSAGENYLVATKDGSVDLYYDNSKKFETTNTGAIVTGTLVATATTATNVTVANEASDTECFVMFGVNATGDNAPKSSSSLKYNSSTGGLTAGSFIGDGSGLTGITASGSGVIIRDDGSLVGTAGTIDFGSNVSVSPISAGVVTVTAAAGSIPGISTAQTTQLNNLTVAGVSTFTGAIDANSDLDVAGHISLRDNDEIRLGTDNDLYIRNRPHTGGFNYAEIAHTGDSFTIQSNKFVIDAVGGSNMIQCFRNGPVDVYYSGSKKFETSGVGVTITSQLDTTNIVASGVITATTFSGSGASLTTLNASELDSGTIPDARFPSTLPAISGANLTNLPASGISTAFTNVQATWSVGGDTGGYTFTGPGQDGAEQNPDIYLVRGQRYRFINTTGSGHPFRIQSDTSGTAYTDGVSGSQSGTQDFNVQHDAPARLYYQCTIHSGMIGNIYIVGGSDWRMTDVATNATPEIFTNLNVGIGTDNPYHELHIQGSSDTRALITSGGTGDAVMMFENASGNTWGHGIDLTNNNYVIAYNGTSDPSLTTDGMFEITGIGSVGVGLANPDSNFHVISSSNHVATFEYSSTSDMAIQLKNSQGSMYFGLGGGEEFMVSTDPDLNGTGNNKFSVDSSGRVRAPEQPAALVYKTGTTQSFSADGLVTYDATAYSQGITIANTRSRMTVPVAGKYMINACTSGSCTTVSAGDGWKIRILKNGSVYNHTYGFPIETTGSEVGQELAYTVSMVVDASTNDYFEIQIENIGTARAGMSYGYFGIYLLG